MPKLKPLLLGTVITAISSTNAIADVKINGFASIVGGVDLDEATFRNSPYDEDFSFKPESKFALQVSSSLGEGLSATAQIMARGSTDFKANFEWAYLSYELNDNHTFRSGRLRLPFYKYSDYLDVGFAYPWIRPPKAMYSLLFNTYDGVSLLSNFYAGGIDITTNIIYGNVEETFFKTTTPTEGKLEGFKGINVQFSKDWLSGYAAYMYGDVFIPQAGMVALADALDTNVPSLNLGTEVKIDNDVGSFIGLGITADLDQFLINAEYSEVTVDDSLLLDNSQWYVSLAYRLDSYTPYLTYQHTENEQNTEVASKLSAVPPLATTVQGAFDGQLFEYTATTLGVRYDFHPSAALKFEYNAFSKIVDVTAGWGTPTDKESSSNITISIDLVF